MYKLRSRIINFRVTDEELERLKSASALQGARCLSDFARSVMLATADGSPPNAEQPGNNRILAVEQRLSSLESSLARMQGVLVSVSGPKTQD